MLKLILLLQIIHKGIQKHCNECFWTEVRLVWSVSFHFLRQKETIFYVIGDDGCEVNHSDDNLVNKWPCCCCCCWCHISPSQVENFPWLSCQQADRNVLPRSGFDSLKGKFLMLQRQKLIDRIRVRIRAKITLGPCHNRTSEQACCFSPSIVSQ